ncbi:MAG TPA: DUF2785 domain-containing protein [Jiangellaceae bacterium]|nr:DUF2785 domain-containing protein [Jiangellaceae bacterium]
MRLSYWERVVADGYRVPHGAALDDLTTDLVKMLGDGDPRVRDDIAYSVLSTWVSEGVYDELLAGLGDGLVLGLRVGLGEDGTDTVLRRSFSAVGLAAVIARDNAVHTLHPTTVLTWADRSVAWFLAERDLRGWVPERGWVHAGAHGADLLGTLAASRYLGPEELRVLLDVIAERLLIPTEHRFAAGEDDRLAFATMSLLHRDLVSVDELESWLDRVAALWADPLTPGERESATRTNAVAYARALHLQLLLGVTGTPVQDSMAIPAVNPGCRPDLLIALQRSLRSSAPLILRRA